MNCGFTVTLMVFFAVNKPLSINQSTYLSFYPFTYLSISLSNLLSIYLSIYPGLRVYVNKKHLLHGHISIKVIKCNMNENKNKIIASGYIILILNNCTFMQKYEDYCNIFNILLISLIYFREVILFLWILK